MKISRYTVTTTQYSMAFYCACVYGNGMIVLLYISYRLVFLPAGRALHTRPAGKNTTELQPIMILLELEPGG